jgi:riboflavin kinase/FMN adenylyltransferase
VPLRHKPALTGIFAVRVHGLAAAPLTGVASLGVRPTVKSGALPLLEVFLFDFDATIYGRRITVEFVQKLRDEERYPDLDALSAQIRADVAQARELFAAGA